MSDYNIFISDFLSFINNIFKDIDINTYDLNVLKDNIGSYFIDKQKQINDFNNTQKYNIFCLNLNIYLTINKFIKQERNFDLYKYIILLINIKK